MNNGMLRVELVANVIMGQLCHSYAGVRHTRAGGYPALAQRAYSMKRGSRLRENDHLRKIASLRKSDGLCKDGDLRKNDSLRKKRQAFLQILSYIGRLWNIMNADLDFI